MRVKNWSLPLLRTHQIAGLVLILCTGAIVFFAVSTLKSYAKIFDGMVIDGVNALPTTPKFLL